MDRQRNSITKLEEQAKHNLLRISTDSKITGRDSQSTKDVSEPQLGISEDSNFFDSNTLEQDENYAEGTYGKQKQVRKEPLPILSVSRKVLGKPPKFLRKENSTK